MAETINNLESSITQLKESREKGMRDVVKEKERLQEEVKKAMHKVSFDSYRENNLVQIMMESLNTKGHEDGRGKVKTGGEVFQ